MKGGGFAGCHDRDIELLQPVIGAHVVFVMMGVDGHLQVLAREELPQLL